MCFWTLEWLKKDESDGFGWKIFEKRKGKLYSLSLPALTRRGEHEIIRPRHKWLTAKVRSMWSVIDTQYYTSGWSVYTDRDALRETVQLHKSYCLLHDPKSEVVVHRVKYKGAIYAGTINWNGMFKPRCIQAPEIRILEEVHVA